MWRAAGLEPGDIRSLEDIARLPTFTIADLRDSIERKPPFGDYMGISPVDARRVPLVLVSSGGTTGLPRPMLYAPREREIMSIIRARSLHMHGVRPGDFVQITLALGLSNGGIGTRDALLRYNGALAIPTGSGNSTPSRRQIEIARSWGTNVMLGFPSYLRHLILADFAMSAFISAANCSGVEMNGSKPRPANFSTISGSARMRPISPESLSMMPAGVPPGASTPYQIFTPNPRRPCSVKVGT